MQLFERNFGRFWRMELPELVCRGKQETFKFVDRVLFIVGATNLRSQRAVEKIGGNGGKGVDLFPLGGRRFAGVLGGRIDAALNPFEPLSGATARRSSTSGS